MIGIELTAVLFGLAAAASWGAGDFSGGMATKRSHVYRVVLLSHIVGVAGLFVLIGLFGEALPATADLVFGALGGISGAVGVAALYTGLAQGRMGVVAPLTAVITAIVPVLFSLFSEGAPTIQQFSGFGLALTAVWIISGDGATGLRWRDLRLPVVSGMGFGLFFIFIDQASDNAVLWPLVGARAASILMMLILVLFSRRGERPSRSQMGFIILAGISDTVGNTFFALATSLGRLDIVAVLGSLYPASTVFLARFILDEQITRRQWAGLVAALIAVILISA